MKIFFDNIIYYLQRSGGGSVYWTEIIKRALSDKELDISFIEQDKLSNNIFRQNINLSPLIFERKSLSFSLIFNYKLNCKVKNIFHSSYYRITKNKFSINIVTIHDFTAEKYFSGFRWFIHKFRKKRAIYNADGIICISENTRMDLINMYPDIVKKKIQVIYNGVSNEYYKLPDNYLSENPAFTSFSNRKFVLFIGHRSPYKNFNIAVKTITQLSDEYYFVIVGEKLNITEVLFLNENLPNRYICLSKLVNSEVNYLYNKAFCLLYPSSYEGFGIPVIEAMKAGCPVVSTNLSSIPEIAENNALLVDSVKPELFAEMIKKLEDVDFRDNLISGGFKQSQKFSWDKCYLEVKNFYKECYNENR